MNITRRPYADRLAAARLEFQSLTHGLPERLLRARLTSLSTPGLAREKIDPMIVALAKQALDALKQVDALDADVGEYRRLEKIDPDMRVPAEPDFQRNRLARMRELEDRVKEGNRKLDLITADRLEFATAEAVKVYEREDAESARVARIRAIAAEKAGPVDPKEDEIATLLARSGKA